MSLPPVELCVGAARTRKELKYASRLTKDSSRASCDDNFNSIYFNVLKKDIHRTTHDRL